MRTRAILIRSTAAALLLIGSAAAGAGPVAANDLQQTRPDAYSVSRDVTLTVPAPGLLANDDPWQPGMQAFLVSGPTSGTLTSFSSDGSFTYVPSPGFTGTATFVYRMDTPSWRGNQATVTITVTSPPVANDDAVSGVEDSALSGNVLSNDTDPDTTTLTATLSAGPSNGVVTLDADGTFLYSPAANFSGTDTFTYRASDGLGTSNLATVTLTVAGAPDAPVAQDDAYSTLEDTVLTATTVLVNDADVDGEPLMVLTTSGGPTDGTLAMEPDGTFVYTPDAEFSGTDSFQYTVSDGTLTDTATVTITVGSDNDTPVASDQSATTAEDTAVSGTFEATDPDSATLTFAVVSGPDRGALTLDPATGAFTYTPRLDSNGTDRATIEVCDGDGACDTGVMTITVTAVNDAPVAGLPGGSTRTGTVGAETVLTGTAADVDGTPLVYSWTQTGGPAATLTTSGAELRFTPTVGGTYAFSFSACDPGGMCDAESVTVTVPAAPATAAAASVRTAGLAVTGTDLMTPITAGGLAVLLGAMMLAIRARSGPKTHHRA